MNQPEELNSEFEQQLTAALRHVDPPKGFAERTLARIQPRRLPRVALFVVPRLRLWASGALAAALMAGVFVGEQTHLRHQRQRAARAQQQFDAAMRITDQTLEHVRVQLQQAGISIGN